MDPPERGTKCTECRTNVDASRHFTEKHKIYAAKSRTTQVLNKQMIHKVLGVDDTNRGESAILSAKELRAKYEGNVIHLDEKYLPFLTKSHVDLLTEANSRGYLHELYQCATCKHFVTDSATLRQHIKQTSGHRQMHRLLEFANRLDTLLRFANSQQRCDADEWVLCGICMDTVKISGFAIHQQLKHPHLAFFACTVCFEIFGNQATDVYYHEYFHHGVVGVGHPPDMSKLPPDPRFCFICGSGFSALEPGQLTKHYVKQHSQFATTPIGNSSGFHLCLICGLADVVKMHYDKHWNSHRLIVNDQLFEMEKRSVYLKSNVLEGGEVQFTCGHCEKNLLLGTDAVKHFINEHMSASDAEALRQFHATHVTAKKYCRMCLFMNQI